MAQNITMQAQGNTPRRRISRLVEALAIAFATTTYVPQAFSEELTIDGSSARSFETSVAAMQNDLRGIRREALESALAIIWLRNTRDPNDFDRNTKFDVNDIQAMWDVSEDLLADIARGDVVPAIEKLERADGYKATDYFRELDDLSYDEIIALAGEPGARGQVVLAGYKLQSLCDGQSVSLIRTQMCMSYRRTRERFRPIWDANGGIFTTMTGDALDAATAAFNAQQYADARAAVATLNINQLLPYERQATERVLASISYAEQDYGSARGHLMNALETGALDRETAAAIQAFVRWVEHGGGSR